MKRAILTVVIYIVVAVIASAILVGSLILFLAMPDILRWVAGYIGEFITWVVFISIIGSVIIFCVAE